VRNPEVDSRPQFASTSTGSGPRPSWVKDLLSEVAAAATLRACAWSTIPGSSRTEPSPLMSTVHSSSYSAVSPPRRARRAAAVSPSGACCPYR